MKVRLIRKLAECLDGIDVSTKHEGDLLTLNPAEAELLIAEGWAVPYPTRSRDVRSSTVRVRALTADSDDKRRRLSGVAARLRVIHDQLDQGLFDPCDQRRTEDRIREEIHDARAHVA